MKRHLFGVPPPPNRSTFEDAAASYEWFRDKCNLNESMEENRETLKLKINEAKLLGERANQSRFNHIFRIVFIILFVIWLILIEIQ